MQRLNVLPACLALWVGLMACVATRADELSDVQRLHYAGQTAAAMQRADHFLTTHPKDPQMRFLKGVMLSDGIVRGQITSTPEPASLALVATGLVGLAGFARRRRVA